MTPSTTSHTTMVSFLITGANAGLGKEAARLVALKPETTRVVLACRNPEKAAVAKDELEKITNKVGVFETLIVDTSNIESVEEALTKLGTTPIDVLIMNAGGLGGAEAAMKTKEDVPALFATNTLGHVKLLHGLLEKNLLTTAAMYASSEAARGIPSMGFAAPPPLSEKSVDEIISVIKGSKKYDPSKEYGQVKYVGTMWMASLARRYPNIKFVSVSPGFTYGTNALKSAPKPMQLVFKYIMIPVFKLIKGTHNVTSGAQRYVDVVLGDAYESGKFYASPGKSVTGSLVDQAVLYPTFSDQSVQDKCYEAVVKLLE